jgi:hypothetical protein
MSNTPKISNPTQKKDKVDINFIIFICMKQQNRYFINRLFELHFEVNGFYFFCFFLRPHS